MESVPNASRLQRRLLLPLLLAIVAGLQQRLDVGLIPEQTLVTSVGLLVVGYQQRGVALKHAAAALAGVSVTQEHPQAQIMPSLELVPFAPRLASVLMDAHYPMNIESPPRWISPTG